MKLTPVKTKKVLPGSSDLPAFLDESIADLKERSIVVITSKVVSLYEGRTVPADSVEKEELIRKEADQYFFTSDPDDLSHFHFTIVNDTLIPSSGIDESNANGNFVMWPLDPQKSSNEIRRHLREKFNLHEVGVIITDSTMFPSRWGTMGIAIGYSGFKSIKDYIGTMDLFDRELKVSKANIAGGLAAAAVLVMGEGKEQTPIAIIEDLPNIDFVEADPTEEELNEYYISPLVDLPFAPFYNKVNWLPGGRSAEKKDKS